MRISRLGATALGCSVIAALLTACSASGGLRFDADGSSLCSGMGGPTIFGTSLTNEGPGTVTLSDISVREVSDTVIDEIAVAPRPDDAEDPTGLVFTDVVPASYLENWADRTDPEGVELAPGSTIDIFITARETGSPGTGLMKGLVATTEGFGAQPLLGAIEFGFASGARCGIDAG